MKISVIITAGGIGNRFSSTVPKQFLLLQDMPVLMRTIGVFYQWKSEVQLILTLPEKWQEYWQEMIKKHEFTIPHQVVSGGQERYHSIQNALEHCQGDYVMVHDGVRPLVSEETLERCVRDIEEKKAVIPSIELKESIRSVNKEGSSSLDRTDFVLVQTPQCFALDMISKSYMGEFRDVYTDDASVVEAHGNQIHMVKGNEENIKITTPMDLAYAELLLKRMK